MLRRCVTDRCPRRESMDRTGCEGVGRERGRKCGRGDTPFPQSRSRRLRAVFSKFTKIGIARHEIAMPEFACRFGGVRDARCASSEAKTSRARQEAGRSSASRSFHPLPHGRGSSFSTNSTNFEVGFSQCVVHRFRWRSTQRGAIRSKTSTSELERISAGRSAGTGIRRPGRERPSRCSRRGRAGVRCPSRTSCRRRVAGTAACLPGGPWSRSNASRRL